LMQTGHYLGGATQLGRASQTQRRSRCHLAQCLQTPVSSCIRKTSHAVYQAISVNQITLVAGCAAPACFTPSAVTYGWALPLVCTQFLCRHSIFKMSPMWRRTGELDNQASGSSADHIQR
jgi:hypothetical protein